MNLKKKIDYILNINDTSKLKYYYIKYNNDYEYGDTNSITSMWNEIKILTKEYTKKFNKITNTDEILKNALILSKLTKLKDELEMRLCGNKMSKIMEDSELKIYSENIFKLFKEICI